MWALCTLKPLVSPNKSRYVPEVRVHFLEQNRKDKMFPDSFVIDIDDVQISPIFETMKEDRANFKWKTSQPFSLSNWWSRHVRRNRL